MFDHTCETRFGLRSKLSIIYKFTDHITRKKYIFILLPLHKNKFILIKCNHFQQILKLSYIFLLFVVYFTLYFDKIENMFHQLNQQNLIELVLNLFVLVVTFGLFTRLLLYKLEIVKVPVVQITESI